MVEGTALEKRQAGNPGARVRIPPSPFSKIIFSRDFCSEIATFSSDFL